MKRIELEKTIQRQAERIAKSQLIPKCRNIAQDLGEGGSTSDEWATANYSFSDNSIKINYQVYAMGDERVIVDSEGLRVFHAKERVNSPSESPNPLMVYCDRRRFEVLLYKPGRWEQKIETLYHKTTEVSESELADVQQRLGIALP